MKKVLSYQSGVKMDNYMIDKADLNDINRILDIYNSNQTFLQNHMGVSSVSREFILREMEEMKKVGYTSSVIKDNKGQIVGLCDFKIGDEVYLSLFMIDSRLKGHGLGKEIYHQLEQMFKSKNAKRIRIDVVYDYDQNVLGFWDKQGFVSSEKVELDWNGYKSNAFKMNKSI